AASCRPGERLRAASTREASPAMGRLPQRPDPRHTARPVKDRSSYPGSAATHEGRGGTLPPHGPPVTPSASSGTSLRRLSAAPAGPAPLLARPTLLPALAATDTDRSVSARQNARERDGGQERGLAAQPCAGAVQRQRGISRCLDRSASGCADRHTVTTER